MTTGAAGEVVITSTAKAMADEMVNQLPRAARSVEDFEQRINALGGMDRFAEQISANLSQLTRATEAELRKQAELRANAAREFKNNGTLQVPGGQSMSAVGKTALTDLGSYFTKMSAAVEKSFGPEAARVVAAEGAKQMHAALQTQLNLTRNLEAVQKDTSAPSTPLVGQSNVVKAVALAEARLRQIGRSAEDIANLPPLPRLSPRTGQPVAPAAPTPPAAVTEQGAVRLPDELLPTYLRSHRREPLALPAGTGAAPVDYTADTERARTAQVLEQSARRRADAASAANAADFQQAAQDLMGKRWGGGGEPPKPPKPPTPAAGGADDEGDDKVRVSREELVAAIRARTEAADKARAAEVVADLLLEEETLRLARERRAAAEDEAKARAEAAEKRGVQVARNIPLSEATRMYDEGVPGVGRVGLGGNAPFTLPGYDRRYFDVVRPQPDEFGHKEPDFVTPVDDRARQQQLDLQRTTQERVTQAELQAYRERETTAKQVADADRRMGQTQLRAIAEGDARAKATADAERRMGQTQLKAQAEDEARTRVKNAQALDQRLAAELNTPHPDDPKRMQATQIGGPSSNLYRLLDETYVKRTALGVEQVKGDTNLLSATRRFTEQMEKQEASSRGFFPGLISGATSRGLNSTAGGTVGLSGLLDKDNRTRILGNLGSTAGNAIRYSAAYAALGVGTGVITSEAAAIRDYTDSLTDLQVAFGKDNEVSQAFIGNLEEVARIGGTNVAEAMDAAARGVRAFGDSTQQGNEAAGQAVAKVSEQLALITGGKLTDKTGDLIASASAFNIKPENQSQILDAVAYAKKFGGDPNQISQGLANFSSVGAADGFNSAQSAGLISLISGRSDETGQAAATRLSRVLSTLQGSAAQGTLANLGIDTSGTPAQVLEKAIDAYGRLGKAQQQQLLIAAGGAAQQRETTALFAQGGAVLKETADASVALGAGESEAQRRSHDLVGLLKALSADIKGIETGLASTDIFAPIIIGLHLLEPALHALDEFLSLLNQLTDFATQHLPLPSFLPANLITGLAFDAIIIRRIFQSIRADRDAALAEGAAPAQGFFGRARAKVGSAIGGAGVQRAAAAGAASEADAAVATTGAAATTTTQAETAADEELAQARATRETATLAAVGAETELTAASTATAASSERLAVLTAELARLDHEVDIAARAYGEALSAQDALLTSATASTEALAAAEAAVIQTDTALVQANALYTAGLQELAYAQHEVVLNTEAQVAAEEELNASFGRALGAVNEETAALAVQNAEREKAAALAAKQAEYEGRRQAAARVDVARDANAAATARLAAAEKAEAAASAEMAPLTERVNAAQLEAVQTRMAVARATLVQDKAEQELAASQAVIAASAREAAAAQAELTAARLAEASATTRVQRAGFGGGAFAAVAGGYTPVSGKEEAKLQRALAAETDLQVARDRATAAEERITAAEAARVAGLERQDAALASLAEQEAAVAAATEQAEAAQVAYDAAVAASNVEGMVALDQAATVAKTELAAATEAAAAAQTELNLARDALGNPARIIDKTVRAGSAVLGAGSAALGAPGALVRRARRANALDEAATMPWYALPAKGPSYSNTEKAAFAGNFPEGTSEEFKAETAARKAAILEELKGRNLGTLSLKEAFTRSSGVIELGATSTGNALVRLSENIVAGASTLAGKLGNFLTSGMGLLLGAIAGALVVFETYKAGKRVLEQVQTSQDQLSRVHTTGTTSVESIQQQATDAKTLASNDRKASSGIFGSITDAVYGHPTEDAAKSADKVASAFDILARRVEQITSKAAAPGIEGDHTLAFDLNKSTGIADGLTKLAASGYSAQVQFDALLGSIDKLTAGAHDASGALDPNRLKLYSANVGTDVAKGIASGNGLLGDKGAGGKYIDSFLTPIVGGVDGKGGLFPFLSPLLPQSHTKDDQKALAGVDTDKINNELQGQINNAHLDPTKPSDLKSIQDLVRRYLEATLPHLHDKKARAKMIDDAVKAVGDDVAPTFSLTDPGVTLQQLQEQGPAVGQNAAAIAGLRASVGLGPTNAAGAKISPGLVQAQENAKNAQDLLDKGRDLLQAKADASGPKGKVITEDDPRLAPLLQNAQTQQAALESATYKDIDNQAKLADAIATPFDQTGALKRRQDVLDKKVAAAQNPDDFLQNQIDQANLDRDKLTQALAAQQSARIAALDPRDTAGLAGAKEVGDQAQLDRITKELKDAGVTDLTTSDAYNEAVATVNADHISTLQTALDKETAIALASNDSRDQIANLTTQITALTKAGGQLDIDKGDPVATAKDGQHKDDLNRQLDQYKKERVDATNALAVDPNDLLGNDKQAINEAQTALDGALHFDSDGKVSLDYLKKQKALDNARLKYAQDQVSASDAQARALIPAGDDVASANQDVTDAQHALDKLTKGNADYAAAQRTLADKQRALAQAQLTRSEAIITEGIDRTDPVKVAQNNLSIAQKQLEFDQTHGAGEDTLRSDRINVKDLTNAAEDAQFQQNLSDAQTKERLQQATHAQYLQYLKNEHDRLTAIKDKTRQQQDELNQIDGLIKDASSSLAGQFNLGDIKLPSIYEVRKSLAQDAVAGSVNAANTVVNNTISINGADTAAVTRIITGLLGPTAVSRTPTSAGAKL